MQIMFIIIVEGKDANAQLETQPNTTTSALTTSEPTYPGMFT